MASFRQIWNILKAFIFFSLNICLVTDWSGQKRFSNCFFNSIPLLVRTDCRRSIQQVVFQFDKWLFGLFISLEDCAGCTGPRKCWRNMGKRKWFWRYSVEKSEKYKPRLGETMKNVYLVCIQRCLKIKAVQVDELCWSNEFLQCMFPSRVDDKIKINASIQRMLRSWCIWFRSTNS